MSWRVKTGPSAICGHVADEHLAEAGGQRRSEVAHLVGVREDHVGGALVLR